MTSRVENIFINKTFYSFSPIIYKYNFCKTLIHRAFGICCDWHSFTKELSFFIKNSSIFFFLFPLFSIPKMYQKLFRQIFSAQTSGNYGS